MWSILQKLAECRNNMQHCMLKKVEHVQTWAASCHHACTRTCYRYDYTL